jgi:hypothetical protein
MIPDIIANISPVLIACGYLVIKVMPVFIVMGLIADYLERNLFGDEDSGQL